MKANLEKLLIDALQRLVAEGLLPADAPDRAKLERTRDAAHGDFATNAAMVLCKAAEMKPRDLAERLIAAIPDNEVIAKTEIAGPGFINFFLREDSGLSIINQILEAGDDYGRSHVGGGQKVMVEFVSANPTGPLHVGHGRGAAYGATVADLLEAVGFEVHREYYVNDAGRQMDILATSVWLRYLELCGAEFDFPSNGYKGDYVWDIAATLHRTHADAYAVPMEQVFAGVPADAKPDNGGGDKEAHIDGLIANAQKLLGKQRYREVFDLGLNTILDDIRHDLSEFGVQYQEWFSERSLMDSDHVQQVIARLQSQGHVYEQDGALWFRSSALGDEKDRVVVRDNGQTTYFASDIAYHANKLERGFDRLVNIWGADHHGYVPRVKAALQALGFDASQLEVLLVQFAILYSGGEKLQMSTRSGEFVTLRELRQEVGSDAARFFYVMRKSEQHLDFDLDLAKSQSNDNPLYYIQYAHARVCSVFKQLQEKGWQWDARQGLDHLTRLNNEHEQALITELDRYHEVLERAALAYEPHQLIHYLRELANRFHTYYNAHTFLVEDAPLRDARLSLIAATRQVLKNGLTLLGVSAPQAM